MRGETNPAHVRYAVPARRYESRLRLETNGQANAKMFFEIYSRWVDGDANTHEKAKMDAFLKAGPTTTSHLEQQCAEVAH